MANYVSLPTRGYGFDSRNAHVVIIGRSSKGKTRGFDPLNTGSSPVRPSSSDRVENKNSKKQIWCSMGIRVSSIKRVSFNGRMAACQAANAGSIPATRTENWFCWGVVIERTWHYHTPFPNSLKLHKRLKKTDYVDSRLFCPSKSAHVA